jgi:hypothetical protein
MCSHRILQSCRLFPDRCFITSDMRAPYEHLPEQLVREGVCPELPWLYGYKLDFHFRQTNRNASNKIQPENRCLWRWILYLLPNPLAPDATRPGKPLTVSSGATYRDDCRRNAMVATGCEMLLHKVCGLTTPSGSVDILVG